MARKKHKLSESLSDIPSDIDNLSPIFQQASQILPNITTQSDKTKEFMEKLDTIISLLQDIRRNLSVNHDSMELEAHKSFHEKTDAIKELAVLKNERSKSYYSQLKNEVKASIYEEAVAMSPQLIPKKLHEKISPHDHESIVKLKCNKSVQNVENEVAKLKIHGKIHQEKVKKIESRAEQVLKAIQNQNLREENMKKWRDLTKRAESRSEEIVKKSKEFLQSDKHLIQLGTKFNPRGQHNYRINSTRDNTKLQREQRKSYAEVVQSNKRTSKHEEDFQMVRRRGRYKTRYL